jgi:hypothetical protein
VLEAPRVRTDEAWAIALARLGYLMQPGYFYDFEREGRLVVSLLAEPARLVEGVEAMGRLL